MWKENACKCSNCKNKHSLIPSGCYFEANAQVSALKVDCSLDCSFIFFIKIYYYSSFFFFFPGVPLMTQMDNADQDRLLKLEGLCPSLCDLGTILGPGLSASLQLGDSIIGWAKTHRAKERGAGREGVSLISWQFQIKIQYMMAFQYPIILMNKEIFCTEIFAQSPLG